MILSWIYLVSFTPLKCACQLVRRASAFLPETTARSSIHSDTLLDARDWIQVSRHVPHPMGWPAPGRTSSFTRGCRFPLEIQSPSCARPCRVFSTMSRLQARLESQDRSSHGIAAETHRCSGCDCSRKMNTIGLSAYKTKGVGSRRSGNHRFNPKQK